MTLRDELKQIGNNFLQDARQLYLKIKKYPLISLFFIIAILLLIALPYFQVNYHGINNATTEINLENQSRAILAQILGGIAIGIGLYYTWRRITIAEEDLKITQENLKVAQESQITERFTRAIDQLGNEKIEIRLGGIYALERISMESDKDYLPIMKILAAYIREKSSVTKKNIETKEADEQNKSNRLPTDIQVILEVICKRKHSFKEKLDLQNTNLQNAQFFNGHLEEANLKGANLNRADLAGSYLEGADLEEANLERANLWVADLKHANLLRADLGRAYLSEANLEHANLAMTNLTEVNFGGANLKNASFYKADLTMTNLQEADLREAIYLSLDQLSKVKTLFDTKLDEKLEIPLKEKYPTLFYKP